MINLHERMLLTSVGVKPATSWSPVGRASNWATEAGTGYNRIHQQTQTAPIRLHGPSLFTSGIRALFSNFKRGWVCGGNLPHTKSENDYRFLRKGSDQICKLLLFLLIWWKTRSVNKQCLLDIRDPPPHNNLQVMTALCPVDTDKQCIKTHICFRLYVCVKTRKPIRQTGIWTDINGEVNVVVTLSKMIFSSSPASILRKSTSGRHRPVSYPDGPMTARYRFT